jgi:hypothetical protein
MPRLCVERLLCRFGMLMVIAMALVCCTPLPPQAPLFGEDDLARDSTPCKSTGAESVAWVRRSKNGIGGGRLDSSQVSLQSNISLLSEDGPCSSTSSVGFTSRCASIPANLSSNGNPMADSLLGWRLLILLVYTAAFISSGCVGESLRVHACSLCENH